MKTFYIVPHSHLDREWYRTFQENRIKLIRFMDDLLDTMENNPAYTCYTLDAQTSFIDDYFDVKPYQKPRFKKLVQEGRLPIGPWYVQPDEHLPSAEGIIRNMQISKKISDEYAPSNTVGYLPDSFGQSSAFPALLSGFGIRSAVFYRGLCEDDSRYNDFIWEGIDGSQILTNWLPIGYGNAMFLNEDITNNIKVIEENLELLEKRSCSENYLLMCGSDQSFIKKFIPEKIQELNKVSEKNGWDMEFRLAVPEDYMETIREYADRLDIVHGELRKGKRSRTHNSISATRMDIKHHNFETEMKYLHVLEPLSTLCENYKMSNDNDSIMRGWKYIVENHAHDSICCCCTDSIHEELIMRYVYADQIADYLIQEKFQGLHDRIRYEEGMGRPILIYSGYAGTRSDMIETDIYVKDETFAIFDPKGNEIAYEILHKELFNLKDTKVSFTPIPDDFYQKLHIRLNIKTTSLGYHTLYVREGVQAVSCVSQLSANGRCVCNDRVSVNVEEDGTLTIHDLVTDTIYKRQHILFDDGNAGDEYDYSPSFHDERITSINTLQQVDVLEQTALCASLRCTYQMMIPADTTNEKRSEERVPLNVSLIITLKKDDGSVYFKTRMENRALNHRIQVCFDAGRKLDVHYADSQLGELRRENVFEQCEESEHGWHERYYPVFSCHKYMALKHDDAYGFVLMNRGVPQYEIYQEESTKAALTLLSCVGAMGNTDLKYRPGRRSGSMDKTPASQMIGTYEWEYAFTPLQANSDYIQKAECYVNPAIAAAYPEYSSEGYLPDAMDIIKSADGVLVQAFKSAEDGNGHILRMVNPYADDQDNITVQVNRFLYDHITSSDLCEQEAEDETVHIHKLNNPDGSAMAVMSGEIQISSFGHNAMKTFRLWNDKK